MDPQSSYFLGIIAEHLKTNNFSMIGKQPFKLSYLIYGLYGNRLVKTIRFSYEEYVVIIDAKTRELTISCGDDSESVRFHTDKVARLRRLKRSIKFVKNEVIHEIINHIFIDENYMDNYKIGCLLMKNIIKIIKTSELPINSNMWLECNHEFDLDLIKQDNSTEGSIYITSGTLSGKHREDYGQALSTYDLAHLLQNIKTLQEDLARKIRPLCIDLETHIIRPSNFVRIGLDVNISCDDEQTIMGWSLLFGLDLYTVGDYYKDGGLGFYELKLRNVYSDEQLHQWAKNINVQIDENTLENIQNWVNSLTIATYSNN